MQPQRLDSLGERLLRSGIAPRHVRRYQRELRDHYDDAVQDELKKGASRAAAEETAASRLGEPEQLVQSALSRSELRSTVARYPRLVLGLGPVLSWVAACALVAGFLLLELWDAIAFRFGLDPVWAMTITYGSFVFLLRILPLILALGALVLAFRQRLPSLWPIIGAAIAATIAGTFEIDYSRGQTVAESWVGIHSSLLPFFFDSPVLGPAKPVELAQGLMHAVFMLALAIVPFIFWSRRQNLG